MRAKALVFAVLVALTGFGLLTYYMERFESEASGGAPIAVLVALADIPLGGTVTRDAIGIRALPSSYVEPRHIQANELERVLGIRVSMGLRGGESLLWTDLAIDGSQRRNLSGLVQENMRAITVQADATSSFSGLLRPGDRVDALLTSQRETRRGREQVTVPLLQNVLVLAVGGSTGGEEALTSRRGRRTRNEVTLSVTVEQAQLMTFAGHTGELALSLRNPEDIAVVDGLPETTRDDILEPDRRLQIGRRERPAPPPSSQRVVVPTELTDRRR